MKKHSTVLLLLVSLLFATGWSQYYETIVEKPQLPTFEEFKQRYHKSYATEEEENYRRNVFNQNRKEAMHDLECEGCGINVFSDLTDAEKKDSLFGLNLPDDFEQTLQEARLKVKSGQEIGAINFPTQFDWRTRNIVTPSRNQGSCGACWSFEMTGVAESMLVMEGKANVNTLDLSEQYLLECTQKSTCSGGYPSKAATLIVDGNGSYNESRYPYRPTRFYGGNICSTSGRKDFPSPGIGTRNFYGISDQEMISYLLVSPIGVTLDADSLSKYDPSRNKIHKCSVADNRINHGVLLVGYTANAWIIKNSWGRNWGIDGFGYISRTRTNNQNCMLQTWLTTFDTNCDLPNCKTCSVKDKSCSVCDQGFYLTKNGSYWGCQQCKDPTCRTCYTKEENAAMEGRCKVCSVGYTLDITYSGISDCQNSSQTGINNCKVHSSNYQICVTCDNGYVVSSDGKQCLKCAVSNCDQCQKGYTNRCETCRTGYSGATCSMVCSDKCVGGCSSPGVCTRCQTGYSGNNCQIIDCPAHCLSCSSPNTCTRCESGYSLPNCDPIQPQPDGSGGGGSGGKCGKYVANCDAGCSSDPNLCDQCNKNYYGPQCNIQFICDSTKCKTTVFTFKELISSSQSNVEIPQSYQNEKGFRRVTTTQDDQLSDKETGLIIALVVISVLFVCALAFLGFLIFRLRNAKRAPAVEQIESDGSSKSIPYVGKRIAA